MKDLLKYYKEELKKTPKRIARGEDDYEYNDYYMELESKIRELESKIDE